MVRRLSGKLWASAAFSLLLVCYGCSQDPSSMSEDAAEQSTGATEPFFESDGQSPDYSMAGYTLSEQLLDAGWISLFDGVSLFGWEVPEGTNWRVENGSLVADGGAPGILTTPFRFGDFEFRCTFHLARGGNSGVFLRSADDPQSPVTDTYELNICDSHESFPTGSLVGRHRAESVPAVEGAWHQFRVHCQGRRLQVWLDGDLIVDLTDDSDHFRASGKIGLQMNEGRIAFTDVMLRPLGTTELFDGESLQGWSVVDGSQSQFEVIEGAIHVTNGPGFLQTDSTFDDFMLHVRARTNGSALNSGVFFRALPGTAEAPSHGYEMQIQNGYQDGDRTQPADSGTGAIFRRAAARYVVADDHQWFTATLMAQGDRFATWVNGWQVVDWRDTRDPDENPRRGRRLQAGHISLQGHDPTTDLDFRSIQIHEFTGP